MSIYTDIKIRLDIVEVVRQYVTLKPSSHNFIGLCPFHAEKTPSFTVFPDTQRWRCFGACATGGDIFEFIECQGYNKQDTLKLLADLAGVALETHVDERIAPMRQALQEAAAYYHERLRHTRDQANYLLTDRRLSKDSLIKFQLGYASSDHDALYQTLKDRFDLDILITAGLVGKSDQDGRIYDKFRNRIMFPVHDSDGGIIGFGGRAQSDTAKAKYLNTAKSPLFDKSATLYAYNRAAIKEHGEAIIVEGYIDAIAAHQGGYGNTVAQMGTSLTDAQARQLGRVTERLIMALDSDKAGQKSIRKGLDTIAETIAQANRLALDMRVMELPEGYDPDEVILNNPDQWVTLKQAALPAAEHVVRSALPSQNAPASEREKVARTLLPVLMASATDFQRGANLRMMALAFNLPENAILDWAKGQKKNAPVQPVVDNTPRLHAPVERCFLSTAIVSPRQVALMKRHFRGLGIEPLTSADLLQPDYRAIYATLEAALNQYDLEVSDYLDTHLTDVLQEVNQGLIACPPNNESFMNCALRIKRFALETMNRELTGLEDQLAIFERNRQSIRIIIQALG